MGVRDREGRAESEREKGATEQDEVVALLGKTMAAVMASPLYRKAATSLLADILATWAGPSRMRQRISASIRKAAEKVIDSPSVPKVPLADAALWSAPETVQAIAASLPMLINLNLSILSKLESALEQLPPETQAQYLRKMAAGIDAAQFGRLVTTMARSVTAIHTVYPTFLSDIFEGPLNEFMRNTDFGELKEMVDATAGSIVSAAGMMGRTLWRYPSKMACLIAINMALFNIVVKCLGEMMKPLDDAAPESLSDLLFAFFRTIDGQQIASLINAISELIRKLHTGSILLGEGGRPLFEIDLGNKLGEVFTAIDPVGLRKAKVALAEDRESIATARSQAHLDHPAPFLEVLSHWGAIANPEIRGLRKRLGVFEGLPEAQMTGAASRGLTDLDTQEIGEIVSSLLRILNGIRKEQPELGFKLLSSIAVAVDRGELKAASEWIIGDAVAAFKPVAGAVMPALLRGIHELLTPEPGEDSKDLEEALGLLRNRLYQDGGNQ